MKRVGLSSLIALLMVLCSWTTASAFLTPSAALLFLMAASKDAPNDIASLLPYEDYFQSRKIEVTLEKMMELAGKDPVDAKTSIQQLLALRVLAEDPSRVKEATGYAGNLKILQDIAAGKKAEDKLGFSKEYAAWAVARVTGQPVPQRAGKKLAESSLDWFPEDLNLVLALDFSHGQTRLGQTKLVRETIEPFVKKMPVEAKMEMYKSVEELGNVRVDRIAVGISEKANKEFRFVWRFSGKGDHKLLAESLAKVMMNQQLEKIKGPNNEAITIFPGARFDPALAIVGDSDVVLGVVDNGNKTSVSLVKQMLDVRAGQAPSVLKAKLADEIKKVSDKADGLIVGNLLPSELAREFGAPRGPFNNLPSPFLFETVRQKEGIDFRFQGKFAGKDEAKAFIEDSLKLRGQAMIQMKLAEKPPIPFDGILKTLATMKMEAKEETVAATMRLSDEVIAAYVSAFAKLAKDRP